MEGRHVRLRRVLPLDGFRANLAVRARARRDEVTADRKYALPIGSPGRLARCQTSSNQRLRVRHSREASTDEDNIAEGHSAPAIALAHALGSNVHWRKFEHLLASPQSGREHLWRALLELKCRNVRCLSSLYAKAGFADAFAIGLPSNATGDAERLAAHMLPGQARRVGMADSSKGRVGCGDCVVRHRLSCAMTLRPTGLEFVRVNDRCRHEDIGTGEHDRQLDFRLLRSG